MSPGRKPGGKGGAMDYTETRNVIDAISKDSNVTDDTKAVGIAIAALYRNDARDWIKAVLDAIDAIADDESWSEDAGPYRWLESVRGEVVRIWSDGFLQAMSLPNLLILEDLERVQLAEYLHKNPCTRRGPGFWGWSDDKNFWFRRREDAIIRQVEAFVEAIIRRS